MSVTWGTTVFSLGWVIALLVLIAVFILAVLHEIDPRSAMLFGALALARLV